ncbi:hypothetical protein BDP27DRAFT_1368953 [Rhodocollybia butyracea]|uniref:Uncharacterized protein n=1 Tax=Rhodocollybia butyracea TaxID=206335 RepID=A0A9P5PC11_9AGAR|nr:hypothetical protein BDP27DRAFT_1368953 [Rhodocollybia butyracea]
MLLLNLLLGVLCMGAQTAAPPFQAPTSSSSQSTAETSPNSSDISPGPPCYKFWHINVWVKYPHKNDIGLRNHYFRFVSFSAVVQHYNITHFVSSPFPLNMKVKAHWMNRTRVNTSSSSGVARTTGTITGGIIGAAVLVLIILAYWLIRRQRRGRRLHQPQDVWQDDAIPPRDASTNNDTTITSTGSIDTFKPLEMKEQEQTIEHCGTRGLWNLRDNKGIYAEITALIEQRMAEILERLRRVEEALVTDRPPDYRSQPSTVLA